MSFHFTTGHKNFLNDKCIGRRFYLVEISSPKVFSKSEAAKAKRFFNQCKTK